MKKRIQQLLHFINHEIWQDDLAAISPRRRHFFKILRITLLAVKGFTAKDLILRSSALTFYTLLSIVPVLAMVFGIAKGFGLDAFLAREITKAFEGQPQVLELILGFTNSLLQNSNGGLVAGFGFVILLWSVVQVLSNIEEAFNFIWQIKNSRSVTRKFTDYLAIMLVAPIFLVASGSATIFISTQITDFANAYLGDGFVRNLVVFLINLTPYLIGFLLFTLLYLVMPNIKVKLNAALMAGFIAGCVFQVFQWGYVEFQVGVSRYNAIYGSFASFPLFITFLQFSWIIVLIGAEISYSIQNIDSYMHEKESYEVSHESRLAISLYITRHVAIRFKQGEPACDAEHISRELELPFKLVNTISQELINCRVLSEALDPVTRTHTLQPAADISLLTVAYIKNQLESAGDKANEIMKTTEMQRIRRYSDEIQDSFRQSDLNRNILDV